MSTLIIITTISEYEVEIDGIFNEGGEMTYNGAFHIFVDERGAVGLFTEIFDGNGI